MRCIAQTLFLLVVSFFVVGCVTEQEAAFSGTIARPGYEPIRGTLPMGGQFGAASSDRKLAVFGLPVGLVGFPVALVYEREPTGVRRLSTDRIREVYLVHRPHGDPRFNFAPLLDLSPEARAASPLLTPLRGSVRVEQWVNNVKHRIHLDLKSDDGAWAIRGTVWIRDRLELGPVRSAAMLMWMSGMYGEGESNGVALTGSDAPWPPMVDWQAIDARGDLAERGVAVLVGRDAVLVPSSLASRWVRDERRAVICQLTPGDGRYPEGWSTPIVVASESLPSGALSLVRLDHAQTVIEPAFVHDGPATGEVIVIVRDTSQRTVRGRATLRGVPGERIPLPQLDREAKPLGGVAVHADSGHLVALLDLQGRVLPVSPDDRNAMRR